jgi:hypothetical protein
MSNNDEREGGMDLCDDPQSLRHAQILLFIYLFIWIHLARIFCCIIAFYRELRNELPSSTLFLTMPLKLFL